MDPKSTVSIKERGAETEVPHQAQQEKISGTILDPLGGVIPGATVSIIDSQTKEQLAATSSRENGAFEIVSPDSDYSMQIMMPGFQTKILAKAQIGQGPLTIEMELGQIREVVTVQAAAKTAAGNRGLPEPIRVGGNVVPAKLVTKADPVYPPEARDQNVEGAVAVSAVIDQAGEIKDAVVLSGHRLLRDAALDCVRQWRYRPTLIDGEPWPTRLLITIVFKLER